MDGSGKFGAGAITEVAVPKINFPGGYEVEVTGGEVVSEPGAERLFIASDGSDEVKMTLTPVGERLSGAGLLPEGQPGVGSEELGSYGHGSTEGSVDLSNEADSST